MDIRIQNSVVNGLSTRPKTVQIGPFVIGFDPGTKSPFINYATPVLDAVITEADVTALVAAFSEIDRLPRLEYVVSCAPGLERLLLDAGFKVEARHDYLVCSPDSLEVPPLPDGLKIDEPVTDEQRSEQIALQQSAFGESNQVTAADVARIRHAQDAGGVVLQARLGGRCVAAGQAAPPWDKVSEVAGIAVAEGFRGRGIGGAITAAITQRLFAEGVEVAWLEASGDTSWRIYERVGYRPTGKRLYISR